MSRKTDIKKLLLIRTRHLQKLKEQQAFFGSGTPPHILLEIEDIEAEIEKLQAELRGLENNRDFEPTENTLNITTDNLLRVRIHIEGNISLLSEERKSAALDAFAAVMKIPRQTVKFYSAYEGSYVNLTGDERKYADFGITVEGDSLTGDGLLPGDIALIRQQATVKSGEIAAVVISTPDVESLGVLRRYYVYDKPKAHWLLKSSNPLSEHFLVIPRDVNQNAIIHYYEDEVRAGRVQGSIKTYRDAEITIAGKYVGVIKKE